MSAPAAEIIRTEVAVVGAGVAGLTAALHAGARPVLIVADRRPGAGGASPAAQGGVAVAVGSGDRAEDHAADTMSVGDGLNDPDVVRLVTREGPHRVRELLELGAELDVTAAGGLALGREGGHRRPRVVHASGDATGAELVRALRAAVMRSETVGLAAGLRLRRLIVSNGRCVGLEAVGTDGRPVLVSASAVVLATGGVGRLWSHTTNPEPGDGSGLAAAAGAGARLADLEMVQFHPTALADGSDPMALLTEALRGEGAVLVDELGERVMEGVHPMGDLAPRDVVARTIFRRERAGRRVFLDASTIGSDLAARFPTVSRLCRERGLDPARRPVPVTPAAHYHMGGVLVDTWGRTSVRGLWACGEVACTGLHGANRLASNSLLEALVFGARVGEDLSAAILPVPRPQSGRTGESSHIDRARDGTLPAELRRLMWELVGVERDEAGLRRALEKLDAMAASRRDNGPAASPAVSVARLVARSALARRESRGAHRRSDARAHGAEPPFRLVVDESGELWEVPVAAAHPMISTGREVSL